MTRKTIYQKLSCIISNENLSGNAQFFEIKRLFEDEQCLNMQYYMEYIKMNGYVTPMYWLSNLKHF